jgi:hypothetical protein
MPSGHVVSLPGNNVGLACGPTEAPWLISGRGVPADGQAGYAKGALFVRPSVGQGPEAYMNVGDAASCNFDPCTLIRAMSEAARDALSSPPEGLVIYNTTSHKLNVRVAAAWEAVTSS